VDQRPIIVFLHLRGVSAKAKDVRTELVDALSSDAIASSAVTKHIRNDIILQNEPEPEAGDQAENHGFLIADNAIPEAFDRMPFASIHEIAQMPIIPPTTAFRVSRNRFSSS
jgi:hypothetical protein